MLALTLAALVVAPGAVQAHPLGNFTVNRYSGILVLPGEIRVKHVMDLAEIPTFQELPAIDADGDGAASGGELQAWADAQAAQIAPGLLLEVDGDRLTLAPTGATASLRPGQGGLDTLRFEGVFVAPAPDRGTIAFEDRNDDGRIGWREVTASAEGGLALSDATVPTASVSDELTAYPQDALASPPDVRAMTASFAPGSGGPAIPASDAAGGAGRPATEGAPFTGVLAASGLPLVGLALLVAVGLGAWHALLPGHGKTLMAAAMVGSGARTRQAFSVAVAVALMHSASVLALGLAVLVLERTFRPEAIYPWLGVLAGLAAVGVGLRLLRIRWRAWRHHRIHRVGRVHPHAHDLPVEDAGRLGAKGLVALALAGGILPAPSALLVMLAAIQAHRVVYGLALVLAFSLGLAAALLVVGLGSLRVREALARRWSATASLAVPLVSAAAILVVGAALTVRAFANV